MVLELGGDVPQCAALFALLLKSIIHWFVVREKYYTMADKFKCETTLENIFLVSKNSTCNSNVNTTRMNRSFEQPNLRAHKYKTRTFIFSPFVEQLQSLQLALVVLESGFGLLYMNHPLWSSWTNWFPAGFYLICLRCGCEQPSLSSVGLSGKEGSRFLRFYVAFRLNLEAVMVSSTYGSFASVPLFYCSRFTKVHCSCAKWIK